jgi:LCP family protein required for cell wall assembly
MSKRKNDHYDDRYDDYDDGYNDGYNEDYDDGYDDGYEGPYDEDYDDGYDDEDDYVPPRRTGGSGGGTRVKKKISANAKWGIALIVELILIVGLIFALVRSYVHNKYSLLDVREIKEEDLKINDGLDKEVLKGYTNIALFGVDARDANLGAGNRSDAILIASINNDTKKVKVISVYRDTLLEVPDSDGAYTVKVNSAYAYGGPELAIQTLNSNLDLNITEYITINWEGLTRAIDAIGGVQVHVEEEELDMLNACLKEQISVTGIYSEGVFSTGDLILNGAQATAYSRIRSTGRGDITRTERQREVLGSMINKMKKSDLGTIDKVIDEIFPYISTSITEDEMYDLASSLLSYALDESLGFPMRFGYYSSDTKGSCIAPQNLTENVTALQRFLFGNANYLPTQNVRRINDQLVNETGFGSEGTILLPSEESTEP